MCEVISDCIGLQVMVCLPVSSQDTGDQKQVLVIMQTACAVKVA